MEAFFTAEYRWYWMAGLSVALFFPVRHLIWVMSVRRAIRKGGEENIDEAEQQRLRRRAGVTAALLCFIFSFFYVQTWFK
ncbi:MAG: hypothetical protein RIA64_14315 [Rhodospirillales bacterium]